MLNIFKSFSKSDGIIEDETCLASQKVLNNLSDKFGNNSNIVILILIQLLILFL